MLKVLVIGDSSALPREEIDFNNTYYVYLKRNMSIETSATTNNTSYKIFNDLEAFMLYGYQPDIVVLNYGIVDVFPRPYPNIIYRLLVCSGLLPYIDRLLKKTGLYYQLGNIFNFKEVSLKKFEQYSRGIVDKLIEKNVKKIIIIGIIKPYKVLLKSKIIENEIKTYNEVFKSLSLEYKEVKYIDIFKDSDEEFTIWDGYHYSKKASIYLANKIKSIILND